MSDYCAISCAAYDEIEILAMRRARVQVVWQNEHGELSQINGCVIDTSIHDQAEYLVLAVDQQRQQIRLDKVIKMTDDQDNLLWAKA